MAFFSESPSWSSSPEDEWHRPGSPVEASRSPAKKNSDGIDIKSRRDVPNCVPQPEKHGQTPGRKKKVEREEAKVERFAREHRNVSMGQSSCRWEEGGGGTTEAPVDSK